MIFFLVKSLSANYFCTEPIKHFKQGQKKKKPINKLAGEIQSKSTINLASTIRQKICLEFFDKIEIVHKTHEAHSSKTHNLRSYGMMILT